MAFINLYRNVKSKSFFLDCGPRTRDECSQEFDLCPARSICQDLYSGYSCVCTDEDKLLDQHQNCADVKNCVQSGEGTPVKRKS